MVSVQLMRLSGASTGSKRGHRVEHAQTAAVSCARDELTAQQPLSDRT